MIVPPDQLDFGACVQSGQVFRFEEVDGLWSGIDAGQRITARLTPAGWDVTSSPESGAVSRFLRLEDDLPTITRAICAVEPRLERTVAEFPGLRLLRPGSVEESFLSFLCTPNNHMSRIVKMVQHLSGCGRSGAFPTIEEVAALPEAALRQAGFGYRGRSIPAVAREVSSRGPGWLQALSAIEYEKARAELMGLPSIGPKLADCICLFALGFTEAVPVDTHIWKAAVDMYLPEFRGASITPARYEVARREITDRFGALAGWAQQYLFYKEFRRHREAPQKLVK